MSLDPCNTEKTTVPWKSASLRLASASSTNTGRLEYRASGVVNGWGPICRVSNEWDGTQGEKNANVACRELGYNGGGSRVTSNIVQYQSPSSLSARGKVGNCQGDEATLSGCASFVEYTSSCDKTKYIVLRCLQQETERQNKIVCGTNDYSGARLMNNKEEEKEFLTTAIVNGANEIGHTVQGLGAIVSIATPTFNMGETSISTYDSNGIEDVYIESQSKITISHRSYNHFSTINNI